MTASGFGYNMQLALGGEALGAGYNRLQPALGWALGIMGWGSSRVDTTCSWLWGTPGAWV